MSRRFISRSVGPFAIAVAFLSFYPCTAARAQSEPPKARVVIADPDFDFGAVTQGTKVTHDFVIKNDGGLDLVINRLVPACGCTAASVSAGSIPPGQEGKIRVEFDTAGFEGEKLKTVRVETNDFDDPSHLLTIKGIVEADVQIEPRSVVFEEAIRGVPPKPITVQIKVKPGSSVQIAGIKGFSKSLQITETEKGETNRTIEVSLAPDLPLGDFRDRIVVELNKARDNSINIPVYALVKGRLSLKPAQVSFGVIEGREPIVKHLKLENSGPVPIRIKEVKANPKALTAQVKEVEPGIRFVVQVTLDPIQVNRDLRGTVEIVTDPDVEGVLTLGVYGIMPPKVKPGRVR